MRISRKHKNWAGRVRQRLNLFHPYILHLERQNYRNRSYRKLVALTPRIRDELIEHYRVPEQDIYILPNGFNSTEFNTARRQSADREHIRAEMGILEDDRVVIFVANELERKGFFRLIEAISSLRDPNIKLLVIGRVSIAPYEDLLKRLGLSKQVICVGPSADVSRYYAAGDAFALPTYYEAWGLVIVEALAAGLPVLTSRLAGAAVAVKEGRTGFLIDDPHDSKEIASKLDQLLRMAVAVPEEISSSVDEFRWDKVLVRYEQILRENCN